MNKDRREELYNNLINSGKVDSEQIGSLDEFRSAIKDESTARQFYRNLLGAGFGEDEIGNEDEFYGSIKSDFAKVDDGLNGPNESNVAMPALTEEEKRSQYLSGQKSLQQRVEEARREADASKNAANSYTAPWQMNQAKAPESVARPQQMTPWDVNSSAFESDEEKRIDQQYKPRKVETVSDIQSNYADRFAMTERGKALGDELQKVEVSVTEKYYNDYAKTDEYKTLLAQARKQAQKAKTQEEIDAINRQFNEEVSARISALYGGKMEADVAPYRQAYNEAFLNRYGNQMEADAYQLNKDKSADALSEMTSKVDELLAGEEKAREEKADEMRKRFGHSGRTFGGLTSGRGIVSERYSLGAKSAYLRDAKKQLEQAQETLEAAKNGTFASGLGNVFDWDKWTFGVSDMAQAANLNKVVTKSSEGKELTEDEQALLDAALMNMTIQGFYADDLNGWYKAGQVTADSLPFMFEMIINPVSGSGNAIAKGLLKYGLKKYALTGARNKTAKKAINVAANILGHSAPAAVMTGTTSMGSVAAGTLEHLNQNYDIKQDGDGRVIAVRNDNNMGVGEAFARSAGSRFFENQSEMIFNAFPGVKNALSKATKGLLPGGAPEFISRLGATKIGNLWTQVRNNPYMKGMRKRAHIGGIGEEYLEEVYNNFANVAIGEMSMEDATSLQNNVDTFLGLVPTQLFFSVMGIGGYAVERRKNTKAIERYRGMLTEDVQREVEAVANAAIGNPERLNDYVVEVTLDGSLVPEQKSARIALANELNKRNLLDGIDEAKQTEEVTPQEAAMEAGVQAETPEEKHAISRNYEAMMEWKSLLDDEDGQFGSILDMEDRDAAVAALDEQGYGERMREAFNYWSAVDAYEGMAIGANDRVNEAVYDANWDASRRAHVDGRIIEVMTGDNRSLWVKSGNLVWNEDGTVNVALSDPQLIVVSESGKVEMISPRHIMAAAEKTPLAEQKKYNNTVLREQLEKQEADEVELNPNTPPVAPGLTYTDEQGNQMVVTVVAGGQAQVAPVGEAGKEGVKYSYVPVDELRGMISKQLDIKEGANVSLQPDVQSDETGDSKTSEETVKNDGASTGETQQNVSEQVQTAIERVPKDEQGNLLYEETDADTAWDAIVEEAEGDEAVAQEAVADIVSEAEKGLKDAEKALKKAQEAKPEVKGAAPTMAERIAAKKQAKANTEAAQKVVDAAKARLDKWKAIAGTIERRNAAMEAENKRQAEEAARQERERMEAEEVARRNAEEADRLMAEEPQNGRERAAQAIGTGEVMLLIDSYKRETGYGDKEVKGMFGTFAGKEKGGKTIEEAAEYLVAQDAQGFFGDDVQEARNAILDVLQGVRKKSELRNYIANQRKAAADEMARAEREAYEEWTMGAYGMTPEEYESYVQMLESENPFGNLSEEDYHAIFAEARESYYNYINSLENEQRRTDGITEGSNKVLSDEQTDNSGGNGEVPEGGQEQGIGDRVAGADAASQKEAGEIKPVGRGAFGNIYDQFRGKAKEAIRFLLGRREGEAVGALHHPEIGEISLVWGNKKAGLEKIASKHSEVIDNLQEIIDGMRVVSKSDNRIKLESGTHFAVVSREYMGQLRDQWLLTAYEKKETPKPTNSRMDVDSNLFGMSDDTATRQDLSASSGNSVSDNTTDTGETSTGGKRNDTATPQNTVSEGKGSESSVNEQGIEEIKSELGVFGRDNAAENGVNESSRTREVAPSDVMGRIEALAQDYERQREEKRRKPLRERVRQWERALGVKVYIVERLDDVTDRDARRAIERGRMIAGWRTANGEVAVYMPFNASVKEIDKTVLHELVGHDGLRGLLGKEGFDALCDKVWDMMPKNARARYYNYLGVKDIEDKTERRRAAADEYMANLAEREKLLPQQKNLWNRIVDAIMELFGKRLGKDEILAKDNLKKGDIAKLLRLSYRRMESREGENEVEEDSSTRFRDEKTALETVSDSPVNRHQTAISSTDGAKILNNLDNLAKEYENDTQTKEKTFIGELADALGIEAKGRSSKYGTFEAKNGKVFTIRLSNHNATVSNFDNAKEDEGISIVITSAPNGGMNNDGEAHIVEYYYNSIALRKAEGKPLAEIVKSIKQTLYSGEYKDNTGLAQKQEVNGVRFRDVFHGSAAEFERFDHAFMNTGEGNQSFGWGTYVSEVEGVAVRYANAAQRNFVNWELMNMEDRVREGEQFVKDAQQELDYANSITTFENPSQKARVMYLRERGAKKVAEYKEQLAKDKTELEKWERVANENGGRYLYKIEIPDNDGSNYLSYKTDNTQESIDRANNAYRNMLLQRGVEEEDISPDFAPFGKGVSGESIYNLFARELGNDKAASQFLNRNGFVGIVYPVNERKGGNIEGASNYVIFNENDLDIKERTRFRFVDGMTSDEIYNGLNVLSGYSNGAYNLMNALEEYYGGRIVSASSGARHAIEKGFVPVPKGQYEGANEEYHHLEFEGENGETFVKAVPFVEAEGVEENEGIRFREVNSLVAVHNISEENLRKVMDIGGLIMPSIAITKYDMGHEGFGEISLLFDKSTINPSDRRNKVYGGDAWTPRFPEISAKLSEKVVSRIGKKIRELIEDRKLRDVYSLSAVLYPDNIERKLSRYGVEGYYGEEWMKLAYLLDSGKKMKVPMKMKDYGEMSETIIEMAKERGLKASDIQIGSFDFYTNNPDFVEAVHEARIEKRLEDTPEEKREDFRKFLKGNKISYAGFDSLVDKAARMEYDLEHGGLEQIIDRAALRDSVEKKVKTNNAAYNKWVDDLFDGIVEKYGIRNNRDPFTPSGNSRPWEQLYDAATPANILKHMLAENEQGGSGSFFDSNIMGASAESYGSIEEIREKGQKRLNKVDDEAYSEWSSIVTERMSEICDEFLTESQKNSFGSSIDAKIDITNAVAKDKTAKGIYKEMKKDYPHFTMEHAKRVEAIVKEIQDSAISYFEAKPQRIVPLSEVRKAIVPSNVSKDILDGLNERGIDVVTYRRGNENSRNRLIKKESDGIRFRELEEVNEEFNENLQKQIDGTLPRGFVYQLGMPGEVLQSTGIPMLPIQLNSTRLEDKSKNFGHDFDLAEIKDLVKAISEPVAVFAYGNKEKAQNIVVEMQHEGKNFIVGLSISPSVGGRVLNINSIRNVFPKDNAEWLNWINQGKALYLDKERIQTLINQQRTNLADVDYLDLDSAAKVVEEFENPKLSGENVTRFREANENQAIFVSNAEKAVKGIKQEKATPQQWLAMIEKNGGLKAGEDKWLGLSDWLKASEAKTITKEEILDFIGENKIVIEEVKYGEGLSEFSNERLDALNDEFQELISEGEEVTDSYYTSDWVNYAWDAMVERYGDDFERAFEIEGSGTNSALVPTLDYNDEISSAARYFLGIEDSTEKPINSTRLGYTTEGLENKREIALTVPTIESWNESDEIHFGDAGEGRAVAWVRFGETNTFEQIEDVQEVTEFHEPYKNVNGRDVYKPVGSFKSGDYVVHGQGREGNMIYVVCINDKQIPVAHATLEDARNAMNAYYKEHPRKLRKPLKVLVIDEIQSKRHQEGREKGYDSITPEERGELRTLTFNRVNGNEYKRAINETADILSAKGLLESQEAHEKYFYEDAWMPLNGKLDEFESKYGKEAADILSAAANVIKEREDRIAELEKKESKIPAAPFEKNWHELAMKRMLRLAAEEGFDKVAWTTGAQQAERYDLADAVDNIKCIRVGKNGNKSFVFEGMDYNVVSNNEGLIVAGADEFKGKHLSEVVGTSLADKMLDMEEDDVLSNTELRIGGEGMKGFYDKMLPSFVQKYVKKWGAKVGEVELPELEESARKMWSVDVTPEMKESVMEGQTMFREITDPLIQKAVDTFAKRYNAAPVEELPSDREEMIAFAMEEGYSREEAEDLYNKFRNTKSSYISVDDKIYIFAGRVSEDEVEEALIHENVHRAISQLMSEEELQVLADALYKLNPKLGEKIRKSPDYKEEDFNEEMIAYSLQLGHRNGMQKYLGELAENEQIKNILNFIDYDGRRKNSIASETGTENAVLAETGNTGTSDSRRKNGRRNRRVDTRQAGVAQSDDGRYPGRENLILDEIVRLEEELGTSVNAIDSFDALPEGRAKDAIAEGRKVLGWYQDGRVYVYMPNARSAGDVRATVYHEVVGHLGLREMLGDRFNAFLDRVYMNLPADVRADLNGRALRKNWDFREATEEYMAELAERFVRGEKVSGLRKVLYALRDAVVKALHSLGIDLGFEMSDNYLMYVLWASKQNLKPSDVMGRIANVAMRYLLNVDGDVVRPTPPTRPTGTDGTDWPDGRVAFREVTDKETLDFLNGQETMKAYRAMVEIDGKLYPPMSSKSDGKLRNPSELGKWEESEESPDKARQKENGKWYFTLKKDNGKETRDVAYNPYLHSSTTMLNDQFKEAQSRPNLVVVEMEIPVSELTSGYKADKAHDAVGKKDWKAGTIQGQLTGTREVILSRWGKPVRIVPVEEVAENIKTIIDGQVEYMPTNVVTPSQRKALEKLGVKFVETDNREIIQEGEHKGKQYSSVYGKKAKKNMGGELRFREVEPEDDVTWMTREAYEKNLKSLGYRMREGFQDSMLALKELQEAIVKTLGHDLEEYEDAYVEENHLSSKNTAEFDYLTKKLYKPLIEVVHELMKGGNMSYQDVLDYLNAKHGIERNRDWAVRDALNAMRKEAEDDAQRQVVDDMEQSYYDYRDAMYEELENGYIDFDQYCDLMDAKARDYVPGYDGKEDYSGLSSAFGEAGDVDAEWYDRARGYVRNVEDTMPDVTEKLWEAVRSVNQFSLDKAKGSGTMSVADHQKISNQFKWYVPLRGFDETTAEEAYEYFSRDSATGAYQSTIKKGRGRKSVAADMIATMMNVAQSTIMHGNKNLMKQKFLNLVMNSKTGLVTVLDNWYVNTGTINDPIWEPAYPDFKPDATAEEIAQAIDDFKADMEAKEKQGLAKKERGGERIPYRTTKKSQLDEHIVIAKRNGQEFRMVLNGNPRAAQALNGLTNPDTAEGTLEKIAHKVNPILAPLFTTQNPTFIARNLIRDSIMSGSSVMMKESFWYGQRFRGNQLRSLGNIGSLIKKYNAGALDKSVPMERYFKEFIENGAETGYSQLWSVDKFKAEIEKDLKRMEGGFKNGTINSGKALLDGLAFVNRCAENMNRFAVYMTSRESGRSIQRSVHDAKEITVNFNKKGAGAKTGGWVGEAAQIARTFYLFFNAGIQGLNNYARMAKEHPMKFAGVVGLFGGMGALMPLVNALMIAMFGDDDDKDTYNDLPEWVRRNNICLFVPFAGNNGTVITLPLPIELRAVYGLGEAVMQISLGHESKKDALQSVTNQFFEMMPINPVSSGGAVQAFTPTAFQPIVQHVQNKDWTGAPIYKETDFNKRYPEYTQAYKGTPKLLVQISKWLNDLTGGNEVKRGWWQMNPGLAANYISGYTGGVGTTLMDIEKSVEMFFDEPFDLRNIPVVKAVAQTPTERNKYSTTNAKYYELVDELKQFKHEENGYKRMVKEGGEDTDKYMKLYEELHDPVKAYRMEGIEEIGKQLKELKEMEDIIPEDSLLRLENELRKQAVELYGKR